VIVKEASEKAINKIEKVGGKIVFIK